MTYYRNKDTGEIFDTAIAARQDFRENYDGDDPTNYFRFWDMYEEVFIPATYIIHGYEEQPLTDQTAESYIQNWFVEQGYDKLMPMLTFCETAENEFGYKTTVYVYRYQTRLYYETFVVEEREF